MNIPRFGLGTYKLKKDNDEAYLSVKKALELGYRHIDTAALYNNEESVGRAIKDSGISREEIFITTKIQRADIWKGEKRMIRSINRSLKKLDVDYIDQVLLHAPIEEKLLESWQILEKIYKDGKIRHIGVSNYKIEHLKIILKDCKIKPYTNQIECSPFLVRHDLVNFCKNNNIKVVAHSSLTKGEKFDDPLINEIATKYDKSPACILIMWGLFKGFTIIPRTCNVDHLIENYGCSISSNFLVEQDIERLDKLDEHQFATHPQYICAMRNKMI